MTSKRDLREMVRELQVDETARSNGLEVRGHLAYFRNNKAGTEQQRGKNNRTCYLRGCAARSGKAWASMAASSSGNLLEMQIIAPSPRPTASETLGMGSSSSCFNRSSR